MSLVHLSEKQILAYKTRTLSPSALLHLDDHLSSCSTCRDRLWNNLDANRMVTSLREQFQNVAAPPIRRSMPSFVWAAAAAAIILIGIAITGLRPQNAPQPSAQASLPTQAP